MEGNTDYDEIANIEYSGKNYNIHKKIYFITMSQEQYKP